MSRRDVKWRGSWSLAAVVLFTLAIARSPAAATPSLEEVARGIRIDTRQISVSGISSGGFMAHQFHVAHSEHIMGAGIVAGGPYYCARGSILDAVTRCSQFVMLQCTGLGLDPKWCRKTDLVPKDEPEIERAARASFDEAKKQEAAGNISRLANLKNSRVYLFIGVHDPIVPRAVMDVLNRFYADLNKAGVPPGNIGYNKTFPASHTMVRDDFAKPDVDVVSTCAQPPAPSPPPDKSNFIDNCEVVARQQQEKNGCICPSGTSCVANDKQSLCKDLQAVDLAGAILKHIYGEQALKAKRVPVPEGEVQAFDQRQVFSTFSDAPYNALQNASMAKEGYVFIPRPCKDGKPCRLHVAFHGCLQGGLTDRRSGRSGNLFAKFAGYNEWAQANDIVVLYPQIQARSSIPLNPQGCWDWWGQDYTREGYHTKRGKQVKAVAQMINLLAGQKLLDIPAD